MSGGFPSMNRAVVSPWDFDDDFDTDLGWTHTGTGNDVDTGNSQLDWDLERKASHEGSYLDTSTMFGGNFSDTAWICRWWAVNFSTVADNTSAPYLACLDTAGADMEDSIDAISFVFGETFGAGTNKIRIEENIAGSRSNTSQDYAWTSSTDYYCELRRTSATNVTANFSSTSGFTKDLVGDFSETVSSSCGGFDYLQVGNDHAGSSTGRTNIGTLGRVQCMQNTDTAP